MYTIEVDIEVYKQLTLRRTTEEISYNEVVRQLLGLASVSGQAAVAPVAPAQGGWIIKGVTVPNATELRASYKGKDVLARVADGALLLNGHRYDSPSAAAVAVTKNSVNGWRFWEYRPPGKSAWQPLERLRK